ncbi:MAG: type II secretion system protein [Planctomycetota bacterium]
MGCEGGKGLSLVEVLVVLAIMSALMGILLPALGKVRREARAVRGMSNQREIVGGVNLYALDHDNRYPPSVASVGADENWNWGDPRKMTALYGTTIGPHRAMSEYLSSYIQDASVMFCPGAPKRYQYLQEAWDAGDYWDNPETPILCIPDLPFGPSGDAMNGTYCFYWNYAGLLEGRLFIGPRNMLGGRGESELLVSDYLGFAHWRNEKCYGGDYFAYGSCEHFKGASVTPGEPEYPAGSAFWSRLKADGFNLEKFEARLHAGYADGHVGSYTASQTATMKVIKIRSTNEVYEYDDYPTPGYFYLPIDGLR